MAYEAYLIAIFVVMLVLLGINAVYLSLKPSYISSSLGSIKFTNDANSIFYFTGLPHYHFKTKDVLLIIVHIDNRRLQKRALSDKLISYSTNINDWFNFNVIMSGDFLTIGCTQIHPYEYESIRQYLSINS